MPTCAIVPVPRVPSLRPQGVEKRSDFLSGVTTAGRSEIPPKALSQRSKREESPKDGSGCLAAGSVIHVSQGSAVCLFHQQW
eukprot:672119-Amphidinium_carterae.2